MSDNPFRQARLALNLSQYDVARMAGVSKHAVLRLEQGMYNEPLPALIDYFQNHHHYSPAQLRQDYFAFQKTERLSHPRLLGPLTPSRFISFKHPLALLRAETQPMPLTVTSLCRKLCIAQPVISYFENKPLLQHSVPAQLLSALSDNGYTPQDLDNLIDAYSDFRSFIRKDPLNYRKGLTNAV